MWQSFRSFDFPFQNFALDRQAIGIAAERAVAAHHPVARDEHRDIVRAIGAPRRAHRPGLADRRGDIGIAARLARRNLAQFAPYRFLEGGALHIDRDMRSEEHTSELQALMRNSYADLC